MISRERQDLLVLLGNNIYPLDLSCVTKNITIIFRTGCLKMTRKRVQNILFGIIKDPLELSSELDSYVTRFH